MFKVFLILDLYTSSNSWQDLLINKPAHTAVSPRYSPIAKDVSCPVRGGAGGGVVLGIIFALYVPLDSQSRYSIIVYSEANYRPHLCHFRAKM